MYHKFAFSVIVPTFLFKSDLAEILETFLAQSIGFAGQIQLILVGKNETTPEVAELRPAARSVLPGLLHRVNEVADQFQLGDALHGVRLAGSRIEPEPSDEIVGRLACCYPNNVLVLKQDSEDICEAFNVAVSRAEGRYLVFVDRFCRWDRDAFQAMYDFLEHPDNVDAPLATGQILCDDKRSIFPGNYISNVNSRAIAVASLNPRPAFEISGCAIRAEIAEENAFDRSTSAYAHRIYLDRLIVSAGQFGYVKEATIWFRKADMDLDLKKASTENADTFRIPFMEDLAPYFFIPWVQEQTFNELALFLFKRKIPDGILTQGEIDAYYENVIGLLEKTDPDLILSSKALPGDLKYAILLAAQNVQKKPAFVFCRVNNILVNPTTIEIVGEAVLPAFHEAPFEIFAKINNNIVKCTLGDPIRSNYFAGKAMVMRRSFRITTTNNYRHKTIRISFITDYNGYSDQNKGLELGSFLPLDSGKGAFVVLGNRLVLLRNGEFSFELTTNKNVKNAEKALQKSLWEGEKTNKKAAIIRSVCQFLKKHKGNTVVLCSDDNSSKNLRGAAIANALSKDPGFSVYYVSSHNTPALAGNVKILKKNSRKYRFLYLLCDLFVSSDASCCSGSPFGPITGIFKDMIYTKPFVFLPDNNLSTNEDECYRYKKNASYRVVRSIQERETFLDGTHGYTHENLWLVPENANESQYLEAVEKKLRNLNGRW